MNSILISIGLLLRSFTSCLDGQAQSLEESLSKEDPAALATRRPRTR